MKKVPLLICFLFLLSCASKSKEKLIQGKWEIAAWVDQRNNSDILKIEDAPNYIVNFKKNTVYVSESEKNRVHKYQFKWAIRNDTLEISNLGAFKINLLDEKKCILEINSRALFTDENKRHTETLTLIKK